MPVTELQVGASADDARQRSDGANYSDTSGYCRVAAMPNPNYADDSGFRFTGVGIPQGATINSAFLSVYVRSAGNDDADCEILADDVDDSPAFNQATADVVTHRTDTATSVPWIQSDLGVGWADSPDIASVIQEVVNRSGFNGVITVLVRGRGGSGPAAMNLSAFDEAGGTQAAKLTIDYDALPAAGPFGSIDSLGRSLLA